LSIAYLSHGDTKHIMIFPCSPEEAFHMSVESFDLAERFQTPVFVVSDLDIGMNDWMCPKLTWDDSFRPDRGKVLGPAELEKIQKFSRYLDLDGDGIAARTLPGSGAKGAYFSRGSGHDKWGAYTEDSAGYQEVVDRIKRKIDNAATAVPAPEFHTEKGAKTGIVSIGGCHAAVLEAVDRLREQGMKVDYMRIRGFPFAPSVLEFLETHDRLFVVEQNRDAQLRSLLTIETGFPRDMMNAVLDYAGLPLTAKVVVDAVQLPSAERRAPRPAVKKKKGATR
jgi:2-oxoglutarate ferredoxin oxidoreductase subunit alpha